MFPTHEDIAKAQRHVEENYTVVIEGEIGDFHCMKCVRICNYIKDSYCCEDNKNLSMKKKSCESHFLLMCYRRNHIDKLVKAMVEGKKIVKPGGACYFCHTLKQHDEGWCRKRTLVQLFQHIINEEELEIQKALDKYLELRKTITLEEMQRHFDRAAHELKRSTFNGEPGARSLAQVRHRREARAAISKENERYENDNENIRERFLESLEAKKKDAIEKLNLAEKERFKRLTLQKRYTGKVYIC